MATRRITFRLYPTKEVEQKLHYHRQLHKDLYNAAVYNRFTQYQRFGHSVDYLEQQNCLPAFKQVWPEYKEIASQALQATLKRVDLAFRRWFKELALRPRFKSIRRYSGWTYPAKSGWNCHSNGVNGYLELNKIGRLQMRGKARLWGTPTTCTIVYRPSQNKWYASVTVDLPDELVAASRQTGTGAVGLDIGCQTALAITDGDNHQKIRPPQFLRKAEKALQKASKAKRRKRAPNRQKKVLASRRWKKAQKQVCQLYRHVANQRQNWVHHVAADIVRGNSFVATEELEVKKMTRKGKKKKRQKAGLNKSILDVGFGMLRGAIEYKVVEAGGLFINVPTRKVKPSQTCPKCGHQCKKTLDERVHCCEKCGYIQDRDIAAAEVSLLWAQGILPGLGTSLADVDGSSSTAKTCKHTGSMRQLGQKKRQKRRLKGGDAETPPSTQ